MALDWLYGPKVTNDVHGYAKLRSLVLDVDTLLDAQALLNRSMPHSALGARFSVQPEGSTGAPARYVRGEDLRGLGQYDRRRLMLDIKTEDEDGGVHQVIVHFTTDTPLIYADRAYWPVRDEVARRLLGEGKPRVIWSNLARLLPIAPSVVLAGLVVWAEATTEMVPALHALGWFSVLLAGIYGIKAFRVATRSPAAVLGHFIRNESRADTRSRRADTRRDLKVIVLTFIPSIGIALFTAWLTDFFGLGSS